MICLVAQTVPASAAGGSIRPAPCPFDAPPSFCGRVVNCVPARRSGLSSWPCCCPGPRSSHCGWCWRPRLGAVSSANKSRKCTPVHTHVCTRTYPSLGRCPPPCTSGMHAGTPMCVRTRRSAPGYTTLTRACIETPTSIQHHVARPAPSPLPVRNPLPQDEPGSAACRVVTDSRTVRPQPVTHARPHQPVRCLRTAPRSSPHGFWSRRDFLVA